MSDLISRQAAVELIKNYCENGCDLAEDNWCPSCQREQFVKLLKDLSSAEPQIIRCRDCKNHVLHPRMGVPWCKLLHSDMGDDQFCSYADMRGDSDG